MGAQRGIVRPQRQRGSEQQTVGHARGHWGIRALWDWSPAISDVVATKRPTGLSIQNSRNGPGWPRRARRPRSRVCLLKGCGRIFRPKQPMARYCSEACQVEARRWRQWKARRRYRQSANGKRKRQAQSRRYRERQKDRQVQESAAVAAVRVIPTKFFFRAHVTVRVAMRSSIAPGDHPCKVLLPRLSSCAGAGCGAGAALAATTPALAVAPSSGEKGSASAALNAADIVPIYCNRSCRLAKVSPRRRRGRGREAGRICAASLPLLR